MDDSLQACDQLTSGRNTLMHMGSEQKEHEDQSFLSDLLTQYLYLLPVINEASPF